MLTISEAVSLLSQKHEIALKPNTLRKYIMTSQRFYTPKLPARLRAGRYFISESNLDQWARAYLAKRD